mgnify:CR=1 FL=1
MTEKQLKELVSAGVDPDRLAKALALSYLLQDMSEGYTIEIYQMLGSLNRNNHDRKTIEKIKRLSSVLTKSISKAFTNDEIRIDFGDRSDFLRELLETALDINGEENRLKAISSLKIFVKTIKSDNDD